MAYTSFWDFPIGYSFLRREKCLDEAREIYELSTWIKISDTEAQNADTKEIVEIKP